MALNYVQPGNRLTLPVTAGKKSGAWDMVRDLPVVLLTDADASDEAECSTEGVFKLSVKGADAAAGAAVAIGDKVYADGAELNVDATNGKEFGIALGAVASDATTEIPVRLKG
ncbi:capsid cement protein [Desulfobacula phenolica]|uniref:Predicted phage recombinase, RecA/RadA family n=1 Tax=Desulfobacula phenolica TaxID=90732 RepID=A0A1H2I2W0_9BACT|nr:capsid cement protein [Desulfobacula phenolica]SDU38364.1 Predicted phage recombinase, RecA/RadA family [Desulfobacula phenolica]